MKTVQALGQTMKRMYFVNTMNSVNETTVFCKHYEFCQRETDADLTHKHSILD